MRHLLLAAVVLSLAACGGNTGQASPSPTHGHASSPTGTPINVDDMMGFYAQQTVFVASSDHVSAVTLLNHFSRYQIPTNGVAQVSTELTGQWLYLLDAGTPGSYRLRVFEVSTGTQRTLRTGITGVAADRRVLATASDGRVLVLKSDARHAWVDAYEALAVALARDELRHAHGDDAYEALALRPLGVVLEKPGCGDRLLAKGTRVAIVCLATGEIVIDDHGNRATIGDTLPKLVAVAMDDEGTLYVATADQQLAAVALGTTKLVGLPWPSEWSGTVLADGLATGAQGAAIIIAERTDDGAWLRVIEQTHRAQRKSFRLAGVPQGGILALWPFAYYAVDRTIRHVDLNTGLLETMTDVGPGAMPGAVANR
jgi:hypothetical protein